MVGNSEQKNVLASLLCSFGDHLPLDRIINILLVASKSLPFVKVDNYALDGPGHLTYALQ